MSAAALGMSILAGGGIGFVAGTPGIAAAQGGESGTLEIVPEAEADGGVESEDHESHDRRGRDGMGQRGHGCSGESQAALAEAHGIPVEELQAQREAGSSFEEIAEAAGVELDALIEAMRASRSEGVEAKVSNGELTRERADEIIARIESGERSGERGRGRGHRGHRGDRLGAGSSHAEVDHA